MAKISKRLLNKHNEAVNMLKKEKLNFNERQFVFDNYHEGAGKMNNLISAHFTPYQIAKSMTFNIAYTDCFIDLCAGIGILSYALLRQEEMSFNKKLFGICIERSTEYYEAGKKLLPEFHWINGDCFDPKVIEQVRDLMKDKKFSVISNPPYGKQVKSNTEDLLRYTGSNFELKAIEWGAMIGAFDGAFLIPQNAANFRLSGREAKYKPVYDENYKTKEYLKFVAQTGLEMKANNGFSTDLIEGEEFGPTWKDVTITTEIACVDYDEYNYTPINQLTKKEKTSEPLEKEAIQTSLFN